MISDANVQSDVKISLDGKENKPDCPPGRRDCVSAAPVPDASKGASVVVNGIPVKIPANLGRK